MARVRKIKEHRNKIANRFYRPYIEQENTQEREAVFSSCKRNCKTFAR